MSAFGMFTNAATGVPLRVTITGSLTMSLVYSARGRVAFVTSTVFIAPLPLFLFYPYFFP
jgi:hypothetical protein